MKPIFIFLSKNPEYYTEGQKSDWWKILIGGVSMVGTILLVVYIFITELIKKF